MERRVDGDVLADVLVDSAIDLRVDLRVDFTPLPRLALRVTLGVAVPRPRALRAVVPGAASPRSACISRWARASSSCSQLRSAASGGQSRSAGVSTKVRPVADFNDGGLMLQAAEHGLGITLAREMFAADPIAEGRLVRLSPVSIEIPEASGYYLVYPPALRDWPPLAALRSWLHDELARAQREMQALRGEAAGGTSGSTARRREKSTPRVARGSAKAKRKPARRATSAPRRR